MDNQRLVKLIDTLRWAISFGENLQKRTIGNYWLCDIAGYDECCFV